MSRCTDVFGNAEPVQAVKGRYVYEAWIGCGRGRIGFARSSDGGRTFARAERVPSPAFTGRISEWDPAVAVAPGGTVYVSYMVNMLASGSSNACAVLVPAVAVSLDHGKTFARVSTLPLPDGSSCSWGDRDFITVAPDGTVYVTWDYGPRADEVRFLCSRDGSCAFSGGDFNAVVQKSSDAGMTWTQPLSISPGYPLGGVYSAPIVAEPDGTLDVLYCRHPTNQTSLAVSPGYEYFTRSSDGGTTWSIPVAVDPRAGTISLREWWIDGSLAVDSAGNLYAAWDTQYRRRDSAWLAWSSDGGQHWSKPLQVTSANRVPKEENLVEVAAAGRRSVYLGWQTVVHDGRGYATYLRRRSIGHGWTSPPFKISKGLGNPAAWPGDTFGISAEASGTALLSWGSAQNDRTAPDIYAASVRLSTRRG